MTGTSYCKAIRRLVSSGTTAQMALQCIEAGIFKDEDLDRARFIWAQSQVRAALTERDLNGLPYAGQTTEEAEGERGKVWRIRERWSVSDYQLNIFEHVRLADANHEIAVKLQAECRERYGVSALLNRSSKPAA